MTSEQQPTVSGPGQETPPSDGSAGSDRGAVGGVIDRYQILAEIGRGGMGTVFRARDPSLGRDVALKIIHLAPSEDGWEFDRFQREAAVMARLQHPGIVRLLDTGLWQSRPFLVMDLVVGESMAALLDRESISPRHLAQVVRQVALALEYAHGRGVVHRDLKPANVLLTATTTADAFGNEAMAGEAYLTDFGMVSDRSARQQLTLTGEILGTPTFMAPEQALGDRDQQGPWTDVHGLGALLYVGLCGRPPYSGSNVAEILARLIKGGPSPPSTFRDGVPPMLESLALCCLSTPPHHRPISARQVATLLGRFLDGYAVDLDEAVPDVVTVRDPAARWPLALAAALVLVIAGVSVWLVRDLRGRLEEQAAAARRTATAAEQSAGQLRQQVDSGRAELAVLEAKSHERGRQQVQAVDAALAQVRRGDVVRGTEAWNDLVFSLIRLSGPPLVERLADELNQVSGELAAVTRRLHLSVVEPNERERRLGGKALRGLALALDTWLRPFRPGDRGLTQDQIAVLSQAQRRLMDRDREARSVAGTGGARTIQEWLAEEQLREVPSGIRWAGRFCGDVLGLLGDREVGKDALGLYLLSEWDEGMFTGVAKSYLRLLGPESFADLEQHAIRFNTGGPYQRQVLSVIQLQRGRVQPPVSPPPEHAQPPPAIPPAQDLEGMTREVTRSPDDARAWVRRGVRLTDLGHADQALADFDRALDLDPDLGTAWSGRGMARHQLGDDEAAMTDADRGIELASDEFSCWIVRGVIRRDLRDLTGAREDFSRAVSLSPGNSKAWFNRGRVRHEAGDLPGAASDLAQAVALTPQRALSWHALGSLRLDRKDWPGAREALEHAVALDPGNGSTWANLAWVLGKLERLDDSEKALDQALELLPNNDMLWNNRGDLRFRREDFAGALADFSRAIELRPNLAIIFLGRGRCWLRLDDLEAARADFQRCLELNPSDRTLAAARQGLAALDQRSR